MQTCYFREVTKPFSVNIKKPTRERVQRRKSGRDKRIASTGRRKPLQCKMKTQIKQRVVIFTRSAKLLGNLEVDLALGDTSPSGGKNRNEAFEFPSSLKHKKLLFDLDFCDPKSVATQGNDEMIGSEPLQCFSNRTSSKPRQLA